MNNLCVFVWFKYYLPSGEEPGLCEPTELPLLLLLLSLLTDRLERSFFCMRWETGDGCFLFSGGEGATTAVAAGCVPPWGILWPLLSPAWTPLCSLAASPSLGCCRDTVGWGSGWGWAEWRDHWRGGWERKKDNIVMSESMNYSSDWVHDITASNFNLKEHSWCQTWWQSLLTNCLFKQYKRTQKFLYQNSNLN